MNKNMKGLLKGLRYISQVFDEEEGGDDEIQIGFPTDVKHVAHIGADGPSVNSSPSWMNEFQTSTTGNSTIPTQAKEESQVSKKKPGLPRSSRRQASSDSVGSLDSPKGSPTNKTKPSRRRHKHKDSTGSPKAESSSLPNIPKKSRRKKSKDIDGSTKSSTRSKDRSSRHGSEDGSSQLI